MKVLFVDKAGDGLLDLAIRAGGDHEVRYYLGSYDPQKRPVGRGLINRIPDWRSSMRWADLVLLGGNAYCMAEFDRWQAEGVPIIGASSEAASWELDRLKGMAVFKKAGIPVPPFRHCNGYDDAIAYVLDRGEGVAIKPSGDVADKSLSFVAKTPEEAVWRLSRWKKESKRFPQGLILQDRIQGIEMAVGAWFGPDGFAPGWEENHEFKKMMPGDLGATTGEMGTVMRLVRTSKLADKVLRPVEDQLHRTGYIGNVDVNCLVSDDGTPHPLEWTTRFGWPALNIELALHEGDPIEFLAGLAAGDPPRSRVMNRVAVGVVLAIPPFPQGHERAEEVVNVPIFGITPSIEDSLHFADVCMGDAPVVKNGKVLREPHIATAGSYVLIATGTGDTVVEARRQAERVLNRLSLPASPTWRNDIGTRLRQQIPELNRHGYALGLTYS